MGAVAGVGFEAGKETVSIRAGKQRTTLRAIPELVEKALAMRAVPAVQATILDVQPPRLLRLDGPGAAVGGTPEERWNAISTRWADTFAELAK